MKDTERKTTAAFKGLSWTQRLTITVVCYFLSIPADIGFSYYTALNVNASAAIILGVGIFAFFSVVLAVVIQKYKKARKADLS